MAEHLCDFTSSDNANLHIWQWSYGQTVKLVGDNITAGMTVQWAYPGITGVDSRTIIADGDDLVCAIPNNALEQSGTIYGYIYYFTEAIGETRYIIKITVRERASSDETGSTDDTPAWQQLLIDAQAAIDSIEETEEDVEDAEALRVAAEEARKIAEGDASSGRVKAENDREAAEELRKTAELERKQGESARDTAYGLAETARDNAYDAQELLRDGLYTTAEGARDDDYALAENARDGLYTTAEGDRNTDYGLAEGARDDLYATAESDRDDLYVAAEAARDTQLDTVETNLDGVATRVTVAEKSIASILTSNPSGSPVIAEDTYGTLSLPANAADAWMKAGLSGMTVTNLVDGEDIADSGTVTFASISGDKYYESLTPSVVTGTGSDITLTNSSGVTKDIHVIHLNAIGLQAITDVPTLTAMFPHYIEGTVHAGATRFTSVGKNLFDGKWDTTGTGLVVTESDDNWVLTATSSTGVNDINVLPNIKYLPLTRYAFSGYVKENIDAKNLKLSLYYTDGSFDVIFTPNETLTYFSMVSDSGKTIEKITYTYSSAGGTTTLNNFQIEEGDTATTYEPYHDTHTTGTLPTLRRLPNNTRDTYDLNTGVHTQRVQRYVLQSADVESTSTARTNLDFAICKVFTGNSTWTNNVNLKTYIANKSETDATADTTGDIGKYATVSSQRLYFYFTKGTSLADMRTALAGTVIYYQLATPIETDLAPAPALISKPNGTVFAEPAVCSVGAYGTGITVSGKIFSSIGKVTILNMVDGTEEDVTTDCTLTAGLDGFTCSSASADDLLWYELLLDTKYVAIPEKNYEYFDNNHVVIDSVDSKVYQIGFAVASGAISLTKTELT